MLADTDMFPLICKDVEISEIKVLDVTNWAACLCRVSLINEIGCIGANLSASGNRNTNPSNCE